jgi:RHS repeat-associated protein
VTGIVSSTGSFVVYYTYDTWGKLLSTTGSKATTLGVQNPFRYRGYYYDTETGLYYLQSRYYDPETGRFLNADDFTLLLEAADSPLMANLYAYCLNNPANFADPTGEFIWDYSYNKSFSFSGYIYNQSSGPASKLRFGAFPGSSNGCGWIATYNALKMLGRWTHPADIIYEYELRSPKLAGLIGVMPIPIVNYFRNRGYRVKLSFNINEFDSIAKRSGAVIICFAYKWGVHYYAAHWDHGFFITYNFVSNDKKARYVKSLKTQVYGAGAFMWAIIGIGYG